MTQMKDKIAAILPQWRERVTKLVKEYGDTEVNTVKISQFYGGMRGIKCLTTDISYLDPFEGIRFRGYTIPETLAKLPKAKGAEMPYVEGHLYLLLTGEIPTEAQVQEVIKDLQNRGKIPGYVWDTLRALPPETHPMTMFSIAIMALQKDSLFVKKNMPYSHLRTAPVSAELYLGTKGGDSTPSVRSTSVNSSAPPRRT